MINKKNVSVFKAFHDAVIQIVDNFAPYARATINFIGLSMLGLLGLGLSNMGLFTKLGALQTAIQAAPADTQKEMAMNELLPLISQNIIPLLLGLLALSLFFAWLWIGYNLFMLDMHDKESSNRLFAGARYLIKYILATILFFLIVFAGLCFFVIPGIYFALRFSFYIYFIIDKNQGIIESLSSSWQLTAGNEWPILAFYIIYLSLGAIGGPILLLLTFPIAVYAHACLYRQLTKSEISKDGKDGLAV